jgi:hypothetical protein
LPTVIRFFCYNNGRRIDSWQIGTAFMNETDELSLRWKELAEQLGLPPEPEPEAAPVAESAESEEGPRASPPLPSGQQDTIVAEGSSAATREEGRQSETIPDSATPLEEPAEFPESCNESMVDTEPSAESSELRPTVAGESVRIEDQEEGRKPRRRGRRSGKGARARETVEDQALTGDAALEGEDKSADRSGSGKRRGGPGRKKEKPALPEPEEDDDSFAQSEPAGPKAAFVEELESDTEDFSEWNVPSWQDLINSLYRPDR